MAIYLPTNGTHDLRIRYAQDIVKIKRKENIIRSLFQRDYEGDPKGGAVNIPTRNTEVTVASYDVVSGVSLTTSATAYTQVLVDQDEAINELIDGYEASAVPDNLVAQRIDSGAYSLGRKQELYAISVLEDGATAETTTTETTADNMYSTILSSIANVRKLGVNINEIKVVIPSSTWEKLLTDTKFSNTASAIGAELIREGVVSKIGGANVYVSDNLLVEDTDYEAAKTTTSEYVVFATPWAQTVEDWKVLPMINDLKDGAHIGASALQGRMVYKDTLLDSTTARIKLLQAAV
ncbi:MAG: hypothetical protein PF440_08630 [Thiomicrorhabdus sp.]|jgi:hypothetical protein|nr:hypothetical protein [Thiomicrorhabdus sp.]